MTDNSHHSLIGYIYLSYYSIADDPSYLPAIFALCVMGILQNDETLTQAALEELRKVPAETACKHDIFFLGFRE